MKRIALAFFVFAAACSQPQPTPGSTVEIPKAPDAPRSSAVAAAAEPPKPVDKLLQQDDVRFDDLSSQGFREVEGRADLSDKGSDAQGWPAANPKKITVRYTNPDHWPSDPGYNAASRDFLVAICPSTREVVRSWLESAGTHAVLELPSADCQLRGTNADPHGYRLAHLHRKPRPPSQCAYDAPKLPANAAPGGVVDLGEIFPACARR